MIDIACGLQYVGEMTQLLPARVNGHQFNIAHQSTDLSPVAEHVNSGAHLELDMIFMVIELSFTSDPRLQSIREGRWIGTLRTLLPLGMNF